MAADMGLPRVRLACRVGAGGPGVGKSARVAELVPRTCARRAIAAADLLSLASRRYRPALDALRGPATARDGRGTAALVAALANIRSFKCAGPGG
jgi:hypothetical protein